MCNVQVKASYQTFYMPKKKKKQKKRKEKKNIANVNACMFYIVCVVWCEEGGGRVIGMVYSKNGKEKKKE